MWSQVKLIKCRRFVAYSFTMMTPFSLSHCSLPFSHPSFFDNMARRKNEPAVRPCPCQSGLALHLCCAPRIDGEDPAQDAEALMRSRYTAYALGEAGYLLQTWHASTRPATLDLDEGGVARWIGLKVLHHIVTGTDSAMVEFIARYRHGGRAHRLHERSRFIREDGRWFYIDGEIDPPQP